MQYAGPKGFHFKIDINIDIYSVLFTFTAVHLLRMVKRRRPVGGVFTVSAPTAVPFNVFEPTCVSWQGQNHATRSSGGGWLWRGWSRWIALFQAAVCHGARGAGEGGGTNASVVSGWHGLTFCITCVVNEDLRFIGSCMWCVCDVYVMWEEGGRCASIIRVCCGRSIFAFALSIKTFVCT